jgi:DNA-binding MarR family transcriptional regulator
MSDDNYTHAPQERTREVWSLLQTFVDGHSRKRELAQALGFRPGAGRAKVLFRLRSGPMTLGEIARAERFDAPYATVIVDQLEEKMLVKRQADPSDHRRKLVVLTSAGEKAIAIADNILSMPPEAMNELTDAELRTLTSLLTRLLESSHGVAGSSSSA